MDPQFWLEKWESQQIGFHLDDAHPLLTRHWPTLSIADGGPVLVPLCGKSLDLVYLRQLGHPVIGVELSPLAVQQFFAEQNLSPSLSKVGDLDAWSAAGITLIQGDFFALRREELPDIAAVYDRAALIAMPPERQPAYAAQLMSLAPDTAPLLLITLDYSPDEMRGPPFATPAEQVVTLFGSRYRIDSLETSDALADNPGLAARGLSALTETAWALRP